MCVRVYVCMRAFVCIYTCTRIHFCVRVCPNKPPKPRHDLTASPLLAGTASQVLTHRRRDKSTSGFTRWGFMSVHFWGENPEGRWAVAIKDDSGLKGSLRKVDFVVFGAWQEAEGAEGWDPARSRLANGFSGFSGLLGRVKSFGFCCCCFLFPFSFLFFLLFFFSFFHSSLSSFSSFYFLTLFSFSSFSFLLLLHFFLFVCVCINSG